MYQLHQMEARMGQLQNLAIQHGSSQVCKFLLTDSLRNKSELVISVDHAGWIKYDLRGEFLSNMQCDQRRPEKYDQFKTLEELVEAIKTWLKTGLRKVQEVII